MRRLFAALVTALALLTVPVGGVQVVSTLSNTAIDITSSFSGERLTFFGTIGPDVGAAQRHVEGPFHVVVVVVGPFQDRVAREKTHNFGVWLNTEEVQFKALPGYFHVLASGRVREMADLTTLTENFILPEAYTMVPNPAGLQKTLKFGQELIRLMTEEGLYGVQDGGVNFLSDTTYSAQLTLPSSAPPGPYIAQTYIFQNGEIIARKSDGFAVRKIGFERFLALSATQYPLLYGLACVVLALITGWLGGVIFRR
jgi:uncharacterized protein (TIGR02186 family)